MIKLEIQPSAANVVDLSYPLEPDMTLMRPVYPNLEYRTLPDATPEVDETGYPLNGYFARFVTTGPEGMLEIYGTHIEASSHAFGTRGLNIDQYPLSKFVGPGVIIDVEDKVNDDNEYKISVDDLLEWEKKYSRIPDGAIVVLNTGWGKYWGDYNAFFGIDKEGKSHFPGISPKACQWLVDNRNIHAIGAETATIDGTPHYPVPGYPENRLPHELGREIIMSPPHNILIIEYMANVGKLPESGSLIICAPINFVGGSGGMVRCLAILP